MIVSLLGLVISLFAYLIAFPRPEQRRFDIYAALVVVHLMSAIAYWLLSFEEAMDAFTYYRDPYNMIAEDPLRSGTFFIVHVVQTMRQTLGGSFLDHFLFFQCFGMIGVALLARSFNEIADSLGMSVPLPLYAALFLPGLHFWSAGIGKDGLMIMAIALSLWAALLIHKRILWMALAVLIMMLIRPHVAAMAVTAAGGALLFSRQLSTKVRLMLAPVAMVALVFVITRAIERFGLTFDAAAISDFVVTQQSHGEQHGSGANLQELSFPLKVWSLLFRPFFSDAAGAMGLVASIENSILLCIFVYIAYHWRIVLRLMFRVFYFTYAAAFAAMVTIALALINYNIGLGQRQKMMVVTAVLLISATIFLYKRYLRAQAAAINVEAATRQPDHFAPAGA